MQTIYILFLDNNLNFFYSHLFFKILQLYNLTLIYQQLFLTHLRLIAHSNTINAISNKNTKPID